MGIRDGIYLFKYAGGSEESMGIAIPGGMVTEISASNPESLAFGFMRYLAPDYNPARKDDVVDGHNLYSGKLTFGVLKTRSPFVPEIRIDFSPEGVDSSLRQRFVSSMQKGIEVKLIEVD